MLSDIDFGPSKPVERESWWVRLIAWIAPSSHWLLVKNRLVSKPAEYDAVHNYLRSIELDQPGSRYVALTGRTPDEPARVRRTVRGLAGVGQGGDQMTAQIAGASRRSRIVPNVSRMLAKTKEPVVLLGDAGSGKTRTLQQTRLEFAQRGRRQVRPMVPIFVHLGQFRSDAFGKDESLWDLIKRSMPRAHRADLIPHLEALAREDRLVFLFDSVDEIERSSYVEHLVELSRFTSDNPSVRSLFACRINDFSAELRCRTLVLQSLSDRQILEFVQKNLGAYLPLEIDGRPYSARGLRRRLLSAGDVLGDTARNPQILALICEYLEKSPENSWPTSRAQLFDFHISQFYKKLRERNPDAPRVEAEESIVSDWAELAYRMTSDRGSVYLNPSGLREDWGDKRTDRAVDSALESGLMFLVDMKEGEAAVRFAHHRLQEYLTARHIAADEDAADRIEWDEVVDSPRWQETLLSLISMQGRATGHLRASGALAVLEVTMREILDETPDEKAEQGWAIEDADDERRWADRVEFASRVVRELGRELDRGAPEFEDLFPACVRRLATIGRPTTQVKMLWSWSNAGVLCPMEAINEPMRSEIDWVREQTISVVASESGGKTRGGADLPFELAKDLAASALLRPRRFGAYARAVRGTPGQVAAFAWAVLWQLLFLAGVSGLAAAVLGLALAANPIHRWFDRLMPGIGPDPVFWATLGAVLATATILGRIVDPTRSVWWRRVAALSWLVILGVFFATRNYSSWDWSFLPVLYTFAFPALSLVASYLLVQALFWGTQILHALPYRNGWADHLKLALREVCLRGAGVNFEEGCSLWVVALLGIGGHTVVVCFIWSFLCLIRWFSETAFAVVILGAIALATIAFYGSGFLAIIRIIRDARREGCGWRKLLTDHVWPFIRPIVPFFGGVFVLGIFVGSVCLIYLTVSTSIESPDSSFAIGPLAGIFALIGFTAIVLWLTIQISALATQRAMEKIRRTLPQSSRSIEQWAQEVQGLADDPEKQMEAIQRIPAVSDRLTIRTILEYLIRLESFVLSEPAASEYWHLRHEVEQTVRHEQRGLASPPAQSSTSGRSKPEIESAAKRPRTPKPRAVARPRSSPGRRFALSGFFSLIAAVLAIPSVFSFYIREHRPVHATNGNAEPIEMRIDGGPPLTIAPFEVVRVTVQEGDHKASLTRQGKQLTTVAFTINSTFFQRLFLDPQAIYLINPQGAAILRLRKATFDRKKNQWQDIETSFDEGKQFELLKATYPFRELPLADSNDPRGLRELVAVTELNVLKKLPATVYALNGLPIPIEIQVDQGEPTFLEPCKPVPLSVHGGKHEAVFRQAGRPLTTIVFDVDRLSLSRYLNYEEIQILNPKGAAVLRERTTSFDKVRGRWRPGSYPTMYRDEKFVVRRGKYFLEAVPEPNTPEEEARLADVGEVTELAVFDKDPPVSPHDVHVTEADIANAQASWDRCLAFDILGQFKEARDACDKAIQFTPYDWKRRCQLLEFDLALRDFDHLKADLEEFDRDFGPNRIYTAVIRQLAKTIQDAAGARKHAKELFDWVAKQPDASREYDRTLDDLMLFERLGMWDELRAAAKKVKDDPNSAGRAMNLADLAQGKVDEVEKRLSGGSGNYYLAVVRLMLAVLARDKGDTANADSHLAKAIETFRNCKSVGPKVAELLSLAQPSFKDVNDLALQPHIKAVLMVAIAQRIPEERAEFLNQAELLKARFLGWDAGASYLDVESLLDPIIPKISASIAILPH